MSQRLNGKVALVTGSGAGIGEATAKRFAEEGARVVVTDINTADAERVAAEIVQSGGEAIARHQDASDEASWDSLVDDVINTWGQLDVLVNNAGIVIPGTGISMQNRGCGFVLKDGHPNRVGGGKRPFHTIIPGFVTKNGKPLMSFGVMGGHMQPQGHVQMMVRICDHHQNPQAACDAPRWLVAKDLSLALEPGYSDTVKQDLAKRGHLIVADMPAHQFGGAQIIYRLAEGYCAASDPRKEGLAAGF